MTQLDDARYVSLTTFTRDGRPKPTPVWITGRGGRYAFTTGADSWKVRRLRNDARVRLQVSDMRGKVAPGAETFTGRATVTDDPARVAAAKAAVARKYGVQARVLGVAERLRRLVGRGQAEGATVVVEVTLEAQT